MTQITQNKYNLSPIKDYLKKHPKASNDTLYSLCNAITNSQKGSVRKKKSYWINKITNSENSPGPIEKLSSEDLEKRIISALNEQPNNAQLLGKAIEFFIKIKGKVETIDESFDMEELRRLGLITNVSK